MTSALRFGLLGARLLENSLPAYAHQCQCNYKGGQSYSLDNIKFMQLGKTFPSWTLRSPMFVGNSWLKRNLCPSHRLFFWRFPFFPPPEVFSPESLYLIMLRIRNTPCSTGRIFLGSWLLNIPRTVRQKWQQCIILTDIWKKITFCSFVF